ncbi:GNAT family N-acetyltransferase [Micromonospora sp. HM5-17]|uniref:GNAT family N-acetyltransferase n=1 Tax=Micromonospora sp. HM5-17 TaxID=2487710 RepID=UPI0018F6A6C8|nr:GNAT family N-acetyltransferase [Micromonospora sp. HM5-17]
MRAEIRPFAERDRARLRALFGRAGQGTPTASLWGHEESQAAVFLTPYMDLEPESLFLALLDGEPVGFLAGCLDSARFPSEGRRMGRAIGAHRLFLRRRPLAFLLRAARDGLGAVIRREPVPGRFVDPRWPAHLHINVAPQAHGTGVAAALMNHWLDRLVESGTPGCHLQTLVENTRAVRFFTQMGFVAYGPTPAVPGIRHDGHRLHQLTMVWTAPAGRPPRQRPAPRVEPAPATAGPQGGARHPARRVADPGESAEPAATPAGNEVGSQDPTAGQVGLPPPGVTSPVS